MKAAFVQAIGQTPCYGDFETPQPAPGERRIAVSAAAISNVTKARASGSHYSSSGSFPFGVGIDGVGRLDDGTRVYFVLPRAPFGSMAEYAVAPSERCLPLPEGLDDATAAALANPGMSAWAAYKERARLKPGETVLVNGATGTAGKLAVQIAKHMGARKVVATGRNEESLRSLASLGADATISLLQGEDALERNFKEHFAEGVDVVIDYLWGDSARLLLIAGAKAGAEAVPIRFIQVGSASGSELSLPSAALRSSAIELMGSGIGSIAMERLVVATGEMLQAAVPGGFRVATTRIPLSEVGEAWTCDYGSLRPVLTVGTSKTS
jgi:NADPH:quinone reductase-like Zn-dependent oxidoreductase